MTFIIVYAAEIFTYDGIRYILEFPIHWDYYGLWHYQLAKG